MLPCVFRQSWAESVRVAYKTMYKKSNFSKSVICTLLEEYDFVNNNSDKFCHRLPWELDKKNYLGTQQAFKILHEQFFDSDKDELVTTWNLSINICSEKSS